VKQGRAEPALDRLVAEARREPLPELDWDAVEASLLPRLGEAPRFEQQPRQRSYRGPVALALALAALSGAAAAFVVNGPAPQAPRATAAPAPESELATRAGGTVDGDALAVGASLHADADRVVVEHAQHATWTLEPGSDAHVEQLGGVVRIALDRGAISAKVVKSPQPESFVIRVEGTRVAVHGTAFRVVRRGNSVRVEVTEGVVGVGPLGGPSFDVVAPSNAITTLDGVRTDRRHASRDTSVKNAERPHTGPAEVAAAGEPAPEPEEATEAAPEAPAEETPQVSAEAPQAPGSPPSTDGIVAAVRRCFREQTVTSGDLHVSVSTQMSLRIQASGRIGEAVFTPPLAPGVRHCVDDRVGAMKFEASPEGFAVDRVLELER
jgi:hypothetical protein